MMNAILFFFFAVASANDSVPAIQKNIPPIPVAEPIITQSVKQPVKPVIQEVKKQVRPEIKKTIPKEDPFETLIKRIVLIKVALENAKQLASQDSVKIEGSPIKVKLDKVAKSKIEEDAVRIKKELILAVDTLSIFVKK